LRDDSALRQKFFGRCTRFLRVGAVAVHLNSLDELAAETAFRAELTGLGRTELAFFMSVTRHQPFAMWAPGLAMMQTAANNGKRKFAPKGECHAGLLAQPN